MSRWRADLVTLKLFVAVCEERSFSRAANQESTAVSAVSRRIADLEEACGVRLLVRHGRGVEVTDAGMGILARARQVLAATNLLQDDLQSYAQGDRGHVRLLAAVSAGVECFASDVAAFLRAFPAITLDVEECMAPDIIEGIRAGAAHVGLGFASSLALDLQQTPYAINDLAVFVAASHPLARETGVRFNDLLDLDFVALRPNSGTTRLLSSLAARESRVIRYRAFTSTLETAFRVIADGDAIGVFGAHAGRAFQEWYKVRAVPLAEDWARREVMLYSAKSTETAPPTRHLIAFLERMRDRRQAG